jgi:2-polyprenyl-6-methoxyphenol hydroxylase-like FAD-dependent oxidoreductase
MKAVVAGGGPVGIFTATALARRGNDVTLVDRDPGPPADGVWRRAGVMQFEHAHGWRPQVLEAFRAEMPDVVEALLAAGARLEDARGAHHRRETPADARSNGTIDVDEPASFDDRR